MLAQGQSKKRKAPGQQKPASAPSAAGSVTVQPLPEPLLPRGKGSRARHESTAAEETLKDILADLDGAPVAAADAQPVATHVAALVKQRLESAPAGLSVDGAITAVESAIAASANRGKRKPRGAAAGRGKAQRPRSSATPPPIGGPAADGANAEAPASGAEEDAAPAERATGRRVWPKAVWERKELKSLPLPEPLEALDALFAEVAVHCAALSAQRITVTASGLAEALRWGRREIDARQTLTRMVRFRCASPSRHFLSSAPTAFLASLP